MLLFEVAGDLLLEKMEDAGDDIVSMRHWLELYQKVSDMTGFPAHSTEELVAQAAPWVARLTEEEKAEIIELEESFLRDGIGMDYMKERARLELLMLRGGRHFGV